ncbi:MAG: NAD(P)/FAD-dependent oxidoreductase [Oscillospiraceae bacterium]|nr:NAD(P)/FAD-dependent oxidoreductase [Oscillospiraceae bacterium]
MSDCYDIAIVGGGVVGTLTARALSRTNLSVVLLERCNDVAMGTTKANSAIVHTGFDAKPGSMKAKMNVAGSKMMRTLCETLHVPFKNNGSLVVGFSEDERPELEALLVRGQNNGVEGLRLLSAEELQQMEPMVSKTAVGALYAPTGSIVSPFELAIAAAENAVRNGVTLLRNFEVEAITWQEDMFALCAPNRQITARTVVNAAGVHADDIARMIGDDSFHIQPRRGEYVLLDSSQNGVVSNTIFQCPSKMGKGVLIAPTVHGNVLIGPSAEDIEDKYDLSTTSAGLRNIQTIVNRSVPAYVIRDIITSFTGLRAHCDKDDFILRASEVNPQFIHAAGIESPGLSAAPAIAEYLAELAIGALAARGIQPTEKADWLAGRTEPVRIKEMSPEALRTLVRKNPAYGRVVCRCETVSEGEILDAIHAPAGALDLDGVKRRVRAGMGRCQGGFCGTKVLAILAEELKIPYEAVTKCGGASQILIGKTK